MAANILDLAREVLTIEAEGLTTLIAKLDVSFVKAVDLIYRAKGRVIVTGVGKSGIVARKLVATFNSTGTPALFLHPVEAMHGDLGMVSGADVVLALSYSGETRELTIPIPSLERLKAPLIAMGETRELTILIPSLERLKAPLIAMTGRPGSTLGRLAQVTIDTGVPREACPLGLAPTASTTAMLAMGDALAVVLLTRRGFQASDFRRFHPGGSLGERLTLAISEVMLTGERVPLTALNQPLNQAIEEMDAKKLGVTLVVDSRSTLKGIITDGDLRRALKKWGSIQDKKVKEVMTPKPRNIGPGALASQALELMEHLAITVLPVVDEAQKVLGIVHLHDLLGRGEFKFR
ncbi:MAG: KpsF/GutQ family sugar-phosphate isomerase [Deltaproteobacteria bacterium]|nr:KpsF/GutQ family sugar-phosphate isomerase [Deltaproteobacteria bacterium]